MAKNYNFLFEGVCKEDIFEAELYRGKLLRKDIDFMKHRKRFLSNLISFNLRQVGIIKTIYSLFDYCIRKIVDNLRRRNIFLVLLGPDGSGKTTMAKFLIDEAKEKNSSFTNINYIHGRWGFIPNLGSLKGDSREVVSTLQFETVEQVTKLYPHSRKRVSVYMGYYFIDYLLGSLKLNLSRGENCLVVADRHYYDYFITEHFRHYPKIFELIYFKLIQSPDLVVYLKADAEEIRKRKPELTIEQIRYQQKRIEYLRNCIPNLVSIETNNKNQSMQQLNMLINKKRSRGNDHFDENIDSE